MGRAARAQTAPVNVEALQTAEIAERSPGHSSPKTWATSVKKPVAVVAVENLDQFDGEISSFGEQVDFGGTQHVKEKSRNDVGEKEEEEGLCHYERVSVDLQGKISSDISVDSGLGTLERQNAYEGEEEEEEETEVESSTDSDFEEDDTDGMENSQLYENIEKCLHENLDESGPVYENMEALTLENPSLRRRPTRRTEKKGSYRLVGRMQERLESLREEQVEVERAVHCNDLVVDDLCYQLSRCAPETEVERFRLHVSECDSVTQLLLGLVTRLAKVEKEVEEWKGQEERKRRRKNGRNREKENGRSYGRWERRRDSEYESGRNRESDYNEEEERKLMMRREVLMEQLQEARWLKQNIEKRSKKVEQGVDHWLGPGCLARYRHCLAEKERLAHERREVKDRLRLGVRQLGELQQTILI